MSDEMKVELQMLDERIDAGNKEWQMQQEIRALAKRLEEAEAEVARLQVLLVVNVDKVASLSVENEALTEKLTNANRRSEFHHQNHLAAERDIDALRKIETRYRWLTNQAESYDGCMTFPDVPYTESNTADDAIDAAIAANKP